MSSRRRALNTPKTTRLGTGAKEINLRKPYLGKKENQKGKNVQKRNKTFLSLKQPSEGFKLGGTSKLFLEM